MKKLLNTFIDLALDFGTSIFMAFISVLKWPLFVCSVLSVLGITFVWIFYEIYDEPFATIGAAMITIIYTVFMFIMLKLKT